MKAVEAKLRRKFRDKKLEIGETPFPRKADRRKTHLENKPRLC